MFNKKHDQKLSSSNNQRLVSLVKMILLQRCALLCTFHMIEDHNACVQIMSDRRSSEVVFYSFNSLLVE